MAECKWDATSPDECAFMRERSAAGVSDVIPPCDVHSRSRAADYSKSKYENATAERAYSLTLDGFADESIYDADGTVIFDLVTTDEDGAVILRYDSQGFVWVEMVAEAPGDPRIPTHWDYLTREYANDDTDDAYAYDAYDPYAFEPIYDPYAE